ncbi:polysaccharide pyruvyl transferase family protein [Alkalihalobacterium chitinilyticum]|uniref:Polysaccharide pyruvyl transferase family protein n=1 Tax=Alkalihalobacterium chitinilyticum TaxID=2980103 RepID=A0ABT5VEA8_9BACI|nr:polysaccharide pyruvyl transferase family protein [Alkalihalobacterium chitinilyticum]MDE5413794.1 polysaccharide pyruvyl transferase family protein [Alkalihalobacterium chitinilyticum]
MKLMMFAHDGSSNRGCEAIVRSSTKLIKEKLNGAKVFLVSNNPSTDKKIDLLDNIFDGSSTPIKKYSYPWFISSFKLKFYGDESYALGKVHHKIIKRIEGMDICLSIGGDNYCYGEQPGWYEINKRVKEQGKKLVLWACSIGEEDISTRKLEDLKLFDLILARETLTYNMLIEKGLTNVKLCADPAFTMEKEELPLPEGWQVDNTIGINFSPLVMKKNHKSKFAVRELIKYILKTTDCTIALTPHVIQIDNNDYIVLYQLYEEFRETGRVILLRSDLNAIQYKGYIARMRFFIGARTHATIAAYSNYVPTMVLGYSVKSKGIAKDIFGEEKLVLNLEELSDSRKLINNFNEMVNQEEEIKQILKTNIPNIKKMSYKAVEDLKELIK